MRKTLFLLAVLIASLSCAALAQDNAVIPFSGVKAAPGKHIVYARLSGGIIGHKSVLYFDFGQPKVKDAKGNGYVLMNDSGDEFENAHFMACVNKLSKLGWILYGPIYRYNNEFECYLYKEVTNDSEITEGINLEKEKN